MTPNDVAKFANVKLPFNPCSFRELYSIEYAEARTCLGFDFWEQMIAALANYSDKPQYTSGTTYSIDDVAIFEGVAYQATKQTTNQPTVTSDWTPAPKFTGDCATNFDELFCNHLAPYLASRILALRLPFIWKKITDMGVLEYNGQQYESTNSDEYDRLLNAVHRDRSIAWANLQHYLANQNEEVCFQQYLGFKTDECECGCGSDNGQCKRHQRGSGGYQFA